MQHVAKHSNNIGGELRLDRCRQFRGGSVGIHRRDWKMGHLAIFKFAEIKCSTSERSQCQNTVSKQSTTFGQGAASSIRERKISMHRRVAQRVLCLAIACFVGGKSQNILRESDVSGLVADLAVRPTQGPGYANSRTAIINDSGQLEAAVGSGFDCVHVGGDSGPCGGGGALTLTDFLVSRTSSSTLTIGQACTPFAPCNVRFGDVVYPITISGVLSLISGTGTALIYISLGSTATIVVGHTLTANCMSGCVTQAGVVQFPSNSIPLFIWTAVNGSWALTGIDMRAFVSAPKQVIFGAGLKSTETPLQVSVTVDSVHVGQRVTPPPTSSSACNLGDWAADVFYYYVCVGTNMWRRGVVSIF